MDARRTEPSERFAGAPTAEELTRTHQDLLDWRNGSRQAGDSIWRRYQPAIELILRRRIAAVRNPLARGKLSADDILNDAAITILGKLKEFEYRGPGSLLAWMQTIAARWVGDWVEHWERDKRSPWKEQRLDSDADADHPPPSVPVAGPGPLTQACDREERDQLGVAMTRLSERHHDILLLRYYFGGTWDQIASQLGSPSGEAVRKEHGRALVALRAVVQTSAL
jgi:RNA polymerase sigma factor (sigma-70 family)